MNVVDYFFEKSKFQKKECVCGTKENINYNSLYKSVKYLAFYLYKQGKKGERIVLLADNSLFFIISYLGIIKSGATVVLTETRISRDDLKKIIKKTDTKIIFVQNKFKQRFEGFSIERLITEEDLEKIPKLKESEIKTNSEDTAVIIFTSGSTGDKKGVMLSHKNIIENTKSVIKYLELTENDRVEVVLPFNYCFGASLLHTHLRIGGSMVLNKSIFVGSVIDEINQYKCTGFAGVPSTFQILIKKTNFLRNKFPSMRYFAQAGGKLADNFISEIYKTFDKQGIKFYVMYGATEATARLSYLPPKLLKTKLGSIGKGIPGVTLEVLNKNDKPITPGEIGEIVASGENIMQGYFQDPKETKKVLKNGKLYTGDLATVDEDGYIYVKGRLKNIIKSGGHRISPQEIEDVILQLENVADCGIVGIPDDIMGEAIVAIVETKIKTSKFQKEIIDYCNNKLPSYKVPKRIEFVKKIPLTSFYKKDYSRIREMMINEEIKN